MRHTRIDYPFMMLRIDVQEHTVINISLHGVIIQLYVYKTHAQKLIRHKWLVEL